MSGIKYREIVISLTGRDSHTAFIPLGQGSLSIGTRGISEGDYDLWVEPDEAIDWDAFNGLYTGYGQGHQDTLPYGDWPRWFYYSGSDTGFIQWSAKRRIEEFHWTPQTDRTVDLTHAKIGRLSIRAGDGKIRFSTGEDITSLTLSGALENFDVSVCGKMPALTFCPSIPKGRPSCRLPVFPSLAQAEGVTIQYPLTKIPFDCGSLLQFSDLKALYLYRNVTDLGALAALEKLEALGLRYVPDLRGMPKLACWDGLRSFIGFNIEETAGKVLRAELKELKKRKPMEYSSVTRLRKGNWFTAEYGIPFSTWEEKNEKNAVKAYKRCVSQIKRSGTEDEVHQAVIGLIKVINGMDGIETSEREDVGEAVGQLKEYAPIEISPEKWELWFDEERDF